jgi:Bacterial regulatory proteins, tetR family
MGEDFLRSVRDSIILYIRVTESAPKERAFNEVAHKVKRTSVAKSLRPSRPDRSSDRHRVAPDGSSPDPIDALQPAAKNILAATRELFLAGGFEALSFGAIAEKSGELKSTIAYHFGNKAGLLAMLTDSLIRDLDTQMVVSTAKVPPGPERTRVLIEEHRAIAADREYWQTGVAP